MRIGIQSGSYFGLDNYAEGLDRMKFHGFDAVDVQWLCNTDNALFRSDTAEFERRLTDLRKEANNVGIELWQAHGPWRYPPKDDSDEDRAERYEKMARSLYGCAVMGCPHLVIHPIMPFGTKWDPDPERFYALNFEYYTRLSEEAKRQGVILCLENMPMPTLTLARTREILEFVKAVDNDFFRVCLDTGHSALFCQPAVDVRLLGKEYLRVLHVHDNDGARDLHGLPYTGVIDWTDFSRSLGEIGYEGVLMLETGVKGKFPPAILEHERKGVAMIARSLADGVN